MTIAHVSGGGGHTGNTASGSTIALTVQAVGTNNLVVGVVTYASNGPTLSSVKDNAGTPNTYTLGNTVTDTTDGYKSTAYYLSGIAGNPTVITATFSSGVAFRGITADEYSGVATSTPLDVATQQDQTGITGTANAITSGSATTAVDGDLIVGLTVTGGTTTSVTAGNSPNAFTLRQTDRTSGNEFMYTEDFIVQSAHGGIAATFTGSTTSDDYTTFILTFKPAAGGGTTWQGSAALAPAFSLTGNVIPEQFVGASFAGAGSMAATLLETAAVPSTLAPAGAVTASLLETEAVVAALTPSGSLAGNAIPEQFIPASFAGSGSMAATLFEIDLVFAALAGSGSMAAALLETEAIVANLAPAGLLAGDTIPEQFIASSFLGAGSLTATLLETELIIGFLAPAGALVVPFVTNDLIVAALAPVGNLVAHLSGGAVAASIPSEIYMQRRIGMTMGLRIGH